MLPKVPFYFKSLIGVPSSMCLIKEQLNWVCQEQTTTDEVLWIM
jgi:hypothetical protein